MVQSRPRHKHDEDGEDEDGPGPALLRCCLGPLLSVFSSTSVRHELLLPRYPHRKEAAKVSMVLCHA